MSKKNLIFWSFINSFSALIYILLVFLTLNNGERTFGQRNDIIGPIAFLLLFVVSAMVTGTLVFGRPIWLCFNNPKKEFLLLFFYTFAWLFIFLFSILLIIVLK